MIFLKDIQIKHNTMSTVLKVLKENAVDLDHRLTLMFKNSIIFFSNCVKEPMMKKVNLKKTVLT